MLASESNKNILTESLPQTDSKIVEDYSDVTDNTSATDYSTVQNYSTVPDYSNAQIYSPAPNYSSAPNYSYTPNYSATPNYSTPSSSVAVDTSRGDIYKDISERTNGDIYIGVVGPVRTGKSTFIKKFMENLVIPNINDGYQKVRAIDELPQSAAGKTIMTTEPKFIPEEAIEVNLDDGAKFNVRMIDCVGYIVPSSLGYIENEAPRMVQTPWFDEEVPFNMAAEVGTQKVISEHSTIGLVITTDGTITDIPRDEYEEVEKRVIAELQGLHKPFVIVLNTIDPKSEQALAMAEELTDRYGTTVMPLNCVDLNEQDIKQVITKILYEFPVKEINVCMPSWINTLAKGHWLKEEVFSCIRNSASNIKYVREIKDAIYGIEACPNVVEVKIASMDLGKGSITIDVLLEPTLFYKILSEETGLDINCESDLMPLLLNLMSIKKEFDKFKPALDEVEQTGYGIVMPTTGELSLQEPQIIKQGSKFGVKLQASAPSIHLMKANINTVVSPIVGSEKQTEELLMFLLKDFEENPNKIWDSNIFGKSLLSLVNEGLHSKLEHMPSEARLKIGETLERIINEGCNGLICFIL
ncbi:MAG: stage IV sporulation protein A [Oscillospiraceae bacterium]|jgi:stage IV sporulation protein A|nr:stage IV sporulation protein A [Oscillospiraceae bacterium]